MDKEYLGQELLRAGFETWMRYMFRVLERKPFIMEPVHKDIFNMFEDIYTGKRKRQNLNVCPRVGKTTFCKWFVIYCMTINPRCNFIYTSFNSLLLAQLANEIISVLENPIYKSLYPSTENKFDDFETDPIDEFWRAELFTRSKGKKTTYSTKKITTEQGGIILFASVGSQILGFGCGARNSKQFSGMLIMDDPDKPSDVFSDRMREKTHEYFTGTLLSRLNDSNTPILNVQQRVHLDDISGFLTTKYKFDTLKKPLLNDDGTCNLPSQYTAERIKELQEDAYIFSAQYQQEPVIRGGGVIKHAWWRFYQDSEIAYRRLYFTADTAMKTKEWNDFTAIGLWGLTMDNRLYLLDLLHGKFEAPELEAAFLAFWHKWEMGIGRRKPSCIYIEDKASGTGLIQSLQRKGGLPVIGIRPESDKLQRAYDAAPYIAAGNVHLPFNENNDISKKVIAEADAFSADGSHLHDDICDMVFYAIQYAYQQKGLF